VPYKGERKGGEKHSTQKEKHKRNIALSAQKEWIRDGTLKRNIRKSYSGYAWGHEI